MKRDKPLIAIDGRYGLRSPRRGVGEYVYRLITELGFMDRPYDIHVFGDLSADPEVLKRLRFIMPVDLLITPTFFTWEQMAFPQAAHGAAFMHGTANINPLISRIPQILTIHDVIEWHRGRDFPGDIPFRHQVSRFYRMNALKLLAPRAKAIFTVSRHAKRDLVDILHLNPDKIIVTPLGSKTPVTAPVFPKEKYFLVLGAMDPRKNLLGALEAFSKADLKDYGLQVVGIEAGAMQGVTEHVNRLGIQHRVTLQEMVSDEELVALYQKATAFLYLSYFEGFGLPVLEAMATGCPVIASNRSSIPEVVGDGGIMVNPERTEEIKHAMEYMAYHPDQQADVVKAGQRQVDRYSFKEAARLTHERYMLLLRNRHLL